jgi:hypothetical protein
MRQQYSSALALFTSGPDHFLPCAVRCADVTIHTMSNRRVWSSGYYTHPCLELAPELPLKLYYITYRISCSSLISDVVKEQQHIIIIRLAGTRLHIKSHVLEPARL